MNKREGGEYQNFQSQIFCLTFPKISVGETFTVAIISGIEKIWITGGGEYQDFSWKFFCLTVPKNFVGASFTVAIFLGVEKVGYEGRGGASRFSVEIFLSHSAEKLSTGESFSVWLISGIEKFYASEGYVTIF